MIKNYFKIAWRNLLRNKTNALINIGGLALGLTATILIGLWVYDELKYNTNIIHSDRIVQVMQNQTFNGKVSTSNNVPMQLTPVLRDQYGDHFKYLVTSSFPRTMLLKAGETKVAMVGVFMEPDISEMLSLEMINGNRNALQDPSKVLLSQTTSRALFGDQSPMGKSVKIGTSMNVLVGGIYKDILPNNDFENLAFIGAWDLLKTTRNYEGRVGWGNNWFQILGQLKKNASASQVSQIIKNAKYDQIKNNDKTKSIISRPEIHLHPMEKWHLYSQFENGINVGGDIKSVRLFGIIGIFILLLACINFMNLSTARSVRRAKEVGIRKTTGSNRGQLITQFMSESFCIVSISSIFAILLTLILLPTFNELTGKSIVVPWSSPSFWLLGFGLVLVTSLIAGSYPSFYLSSFRPSKVLKGAFEKSKHALYFRRALVVFQFTISVALIIGTITILKQIQFGKDRSTGYDKDHLLYVPINTNEVLNDFPTIKNELLESPNIQEVAASDVLIMRTFTTNSGFDWKGKDPNMSEEFLTLRATHGYGEMIDWELIEGRDFSESFQSDSTAFIINESAVKYMGLENPIGEMVQWGDDETYKIIGVVKDMVTQSPFDEVRPTLFILHYGGFLNFVNIKMDKLAKTSSAIAHIESVFKKHDPENLFSYNFVDEEYERNFLRQERIGKLASFFAFLAILISCLGIFGLSSYMVEQRSKELGMRKVLGASAFRIWKMLTKDFLTLVILSCLFAVPIGYYYMQRWIEDFSYRIELGWYIFASAIIGVLAITLLTTSFQSMKAALANPINSLRSE